MIYSGLLCFKIYKYEVYVCCIRDVQKRPLEKKKAITNESNCSILITPCLALNSTI